MKVEYKQTNTERYSVMIYGKLGGSGDAELPAWFAGLSQDWFAGDYDQAALAHYDGVAH